MTRLVQSRVQPISQPKRLFKRSNKKLICSYFKITRVYKLRVNLQVLVYFFARCELIMPKMLLIYNLSM
jgi:hypothetical protein